MSSAHKKLSVHEKRNIAYNFPGPEKQTHCLKLRKEIGKHKSFRTCCSSCTSWALHKSQVGEVLWVQVTVSIRRVWARSLKQATLQIAKRHREDKEACI